MPHRLIKKPGLLLFLLLFIPAISRSQALKLKDAVDAALTNYPLLKAKAAYANASRETIEQAKKEALPNLALAAQQDFGTVNGQNGPLYPSAVPGTASSGPAFAQQNWNAAFGALYLSNINWDFFAFGRAKQHIAVTRAAALRDENDLAQELFQQQIRVSAAYLNLVAAKRLTRSQELNLERAVTFKNSAVVRAMNGLIAGVDSSLAAAEVSGAKIALNRAIDAEQEQANRLCVLMGAPVANIIPDTAAFSHVPRSFFAERTISVKDHPLLQFYDQRISVSREQQNYLHTFLYPAFSAFGVLQGRGSGFKSNYGANPSAFTRNYFNGIDPVRSNYLLGVSVSWNLSALLRYKPQVRAQQYITEALQDEYDLAHQQLEAQLDLAAKKIQTAMASYREAPIQVNAASAAYLQKSTLYKNGLTTLADLSQALYTLNRAETDRDIAYTNVWQAVLLQSAALGDYSLFTAEF